MTQTIGPGDWVECINAGKVGVYNSCYTLVEGAVYLVERIGPGCVTTEPRIWLKGVELSWDGGYCPERFRPVYTPKQSLIAHLLEPIKESV